MCSLLTSALLSLLLSARSHLSSWLEQYQSDPTPREVRDMVRDMNCATSQKVFIGECRPDVHAYSIPTRSLLQPSRSKVMKLWHSLRGRVPWRPSLPRRAPLDTLAAKPCFPLLAKP